MLPFELGIKRDGWHESQSSRDLGMVEMVDCYVYVLRDSKLANWKVVYIFYPEA